MKSEMKQTAGESRQANPERRNNNVRYLVRCVFLGAFFLSSGCTSTTVLLANFKNDTIGSPPGSVQPTGTVLLKPGAGAVSVVAAPVSGQSANKWTRINHPNGNTPETTLTGQFTEFGTGSYGLLTSLHIPSGSGVVTVQFEASPQSPLPFGPFLHLDFMPEGDVRIDDGTTRFGQFPRDQNFVLSVKLNITTTSATAEITLLGGASGDRTVNVSSNVLPLARNFGAVKFWVGFQHQGTFFVDDIIVTRKSP
jgi:hypothetical protein